MSTLDSDLATVAVTGAAAAFAYLEARTARRAASLSELQSQRELASEWAELNSEWEVMLMMGGHLYLTPSLETVAKYPGVATDRADRYRRLVHFNKHRSWDELSAELSADDVAVIEGTAGLRLPTEIYRMPLRFLARVGQSVLSGRVPAAVVYDVLGPDLLRNSGSVRFVLDVAPDSTYYLGYYPGLRHRVLMLLDVLWAYAARINDLEEFDRDHAVDAKVSGTGARNRRRIRQYAKLSGAGFLLRWKLDWLLTAAEVQYDRADSRVSVPIRTWRWVKGFGPGKGSKDAFPRRDPWS